MGGVSAPWIEPWIEPCLWVGSEHPGQSLVCGWGQSILDRALFVGGVSAPWTEPCLWAGSEHPG